MTSRHLVFLSIVAILRPAVNGFMVKCLFGSTTSITSSKGFPISFLQHRRRRRRTSTSSSQAQPIQFDVGSLQLFSSSESDDARIETGRRLPSKRFTTPTSPWNELDVVVDQNNIMAVPSPNKFAVSGPPFDRRRNNGGTALNSVPSTAAATTAATAASPELVQALKMLQVARTQQEILRLGRLIESLDVTRTESRMIQERVIKATASAGLVALAVDLLYHQLQQQQYIPTESTYLSVCLALRRLGRVQQLEQVLLEIGRVAAKLQETPSSTATTSLSSSFSSSLSSSQHGVSVVALNILLAALCKSTTTTTIDRNRYNNNNNNNQQESLEREATKHRQQQQQVLHRAWMWLTEDYRKLQITQPDATSFATVLNAAAANHNQTLVELVWKEMMTRGIQPDIYCYNARLRSIVERTTATSPTTGSSSETSTTADDEALQLLDQLLQAPNIEGGPDPYTIHWLLMPLVRSGRVGDLETQLNMLIRRYPPHVVSDAFGAFFVTLIQGGELSTARALFDTYVQPAIVRRAAIDNGDDDDDDDGEALWVPPQVRHFNILIDGYRQLAELFSIDESDLYTSSSSSSASTTTSAASLLPSPNHVMSVNARREGIQLYHLLLKTDLYPDSYTLTSVLGLCATSTEIAHVVLQAVRELEVVITPAVIRATITAFGKVLDPASACWVTDEFASMTLNNRAWNVLLGALASGAKMDVSRAPQPLDIHSSVAATLMPRANQCKIRLDKYTSFKSDRGDKNSENGACPVRLTDHIDGLTCVEAAKIVLNLMTRKNNGSNSHSDIIAPRPNSQSFCLAATALQHCNNTGSELATELFRNATEAGVANDGRFVNAVLRCFGDDVDAALSAWKNEIRKACFMSSELQRQPQPQQTTKNLLAAYHGLLFVCGRAFRPDIGVRLVYAMAKEGIEPNEVALKCYQSGKRLRQQLLGTSPYKFLLVDQYESLLFVECTKYDTNDRRRFGEQRVRIIV